MLCKLSPEAMKAWENGGKQWEAFSPKIVKACVQQLIKCVKNEWFAKMCRQIKDIGQLQQACAGLSTSCKQTCVK